MYTSYIQVKIQKQQYMMSLCSYNSKFLSSLAVMQYVYNNYEPLLKMKPSEVRDFCNSIKNRMTVLKFHR